MVVVDDALEVYNYLNDNWNTGNVAKPTFYYDDSINHHDLRQGAAVKIYLVDSIPKINDVTYSYEEWTTHVRVDIRCVARNTMLLTRDEVRRCLNTVRQAPGSYYDWLKKDSERQVAGFTNYFQYVIDITLKNNGKVIPT